MNQTKLWIYSVWSLARDGVSENFSVFKRFISWKKSKESRISWFYSHPQKCLGSIENSTLYTANKPEENGTPKGGSPLALAELYRNKDLLKSIVFKKPNELDKNNMLDEKNIKDI